MHLYGAFVVFICVLLRFCKSQSYSGYSYPAQRTGYTYNQSYYNRPKTYYTSTSNSNRIQSSSSNTLHNPTTLKTYSQQTPQRNYKQTTTRYNNGYNQQSSISSAFGGTRGSSYPYNQQLNTIHPNTRGYYSPANLKSQNNGQTFASPSAPTGSRGSSNSVSGPIHVKQYLTNSYQNNDNMAPSSNKPLQDDANGKHRVSKADLENAKFAGVDNLENEDDGRSLFLKKKKLRRRLAYLANPCFPYGRDAGNSRTPPPKEQGRFLWDVNVYNVYPQSSVGLASNSFGCGLSNFGGLGGGLFSDPIAQPYYPPGTGLVNFLNSFAPGILQNSLAVTARPQLFGDPIQQPQINDNYQNDLAQSDPEVDPNYQPQLVAQPIRRPNRIYYDSAGATPMTPGQVLGSISTTVNGIIQQLTGNVQPVYG